MSSEDPRQYLNDNEEGQRLAMEGWQSNVWTAMPCIVTAIDWETMTLDCVIAIQGRQEDQNGVLSFVNISPIQDVPICFPSCGGFIVTMPLAVNDEVLVVFAARCIDSWWQSGGYGNIPIEYRMHDLSDGFAIPGPRSTPNVAPSISTTDLQIRNNAGTTLLSIGADGKIGFQNVTTSLKTILSTINTALTTFAAACASASNVGQVAAAAGVLDTALTPVSTEIGALLK